MKRLGLIGVSASLAVLVGLTFFYVYSFLRSRPATQHIAPATARQANLTLQTVGVIGFTTFPGWVSYLAKVDGKWVHSTVYRVPAHALIHVTLYQYDTASGLRNPFWANPRGIVGPMVVNGKPTPFINPALASHTFAVPELGVDVPLLGVPDNAKNQCPAAPCTLAQAHNTIQFTFRTGAPGVYRWQCFVPCAFGTPLGNGGPMQTVGYMDGYLDVVG